MIGCIKSLSFLSFINLTHNLFENVFTSGSNSNSNYVFDQLYKWRSFEDGFEEAKHDRKPIFFMIYKLWCPACRQLKENCVKSVRFMDLSSRFAMIKVDAAEDPIGNRKKYQPDGKYVPRILFFTPDGGFIKEAYNKHAKADTTHKYFYSSPSQVIETMLYVLENYSKESLPVLYEHERSSNTENCNVDDEILVPTILE